MINKWYYYGLIGFIVSLILMFISKVQKDFDLALVYLIIAIVVYIIYCMIDELEKEWCSIDGGGEK